MLPHGSLVHFGVSNIESIIKEHKPAICVLNHLARRMSLAEAGNIEVLFCFEVRLLNGLFKFVRRDLDRQFYLAPFELFHRCHKTLRKYN